MWKIVSFVVLLALGGATSNGFWPDILAQVISIALLASLIASPNIRGVLQEPAIWIAPALLGILLCVSFAQLISVGFSIHQPSLAFDNPSALLWPAIPVPGAAYVKTLILASLSACVVPLAVFAAVISLNVRERVRWTIAVVAFGGFSVLLGLMQVAQGPESPLRPFAITNLTEAVGLFANRNHFAALLYVTLMLGCAWLPRLVGRVMSRQGDKASAIVWLAVVAALVLACLTGLAMARSRAGVALTIVGLFGVAVMIWRAIGAQGAGEYRDGNSNARRRIRRVIAAIFVFSTLFVLQFGLGQILSRFKIDPLEDLRVPIFWTTLEAAKAALPWGAGLGSFVSVYAVTEKTSDLFVGYANRAHNDFLEIFLEIGVFAPVVVLLFASWLLMRGITVWKSVGSRSDDPESHAALQFAALLAVLLLLAHSWIDYPLRTGTLSSVFAFLCALLTPAPLQPESGVSMIARRKRHRKKSAVGSVSVVRAPFDLNSGSWKEHGNIPAEWRRDDTKK